MNYNNLLESRRGGPCFLVIVAFAVVRGTTRITGSTTSNLVVSLT